MPKLIKGHHLTICTEYTAEAVAAFPEGFTRDRAYKLFGPRDGSRKPKTT